MSDGVADQTTPAPDPLGFEDWTAEPQAGTPLDTIAQGFLASNEFTSDFGDYLQMSDATFVTTLHETALHRQPDPSGFTTWTTELADGVSRQAVALSIVLSAEAQSDLQANLDQGVFVSSSNDSDIARLYYGLLDRSPDPAGLHLYETDMANGTSLTDVTHDILSTTEYQRNTAPGQGNASFVDFLYQTAPRRGPDSGGFQFWTTALDTGALSPAQVVLGFLSSTEFQADTAGDSNAAYINTVYEVALERQADPSGLATWGQDLANGMSKAEFDANIVGSTEFQTNIATPMAQVFVDALYQGALGQSPPAGQPWTSALVSGASSNIGVAVGIAGSSQAQAPLSPKVESGWFLA